MISGINLVYFINSEIISVVFSYWAEPKRRIVLWINWLKLYWNILFITIFTSNSILIFMLNFIFNPTALSFSPSLPHALSLCVTGGQRRKGVQGFLGVCFILLGTTLLPDNSLKTGKNATWLNDSTLLLCLSLSRTHIRTQIQTQPTYKENSHDANLQNRTHCMPTSDNSKWKYIHIYTSHDLHSEHTTTLLSLSLQTPALPQ